MTNEELRDQLRFAKQGADNLAKRHGYQWAEWLNGRIGRCTAAFDRDGERWLLSFCWTPKQELGALADSIEKMDYCMMVAQKEFGALKAGAMMRAAADAQAVAQ